MVIAAADDEAVVSACTTSDDVWSKACVAALADALLSFEACSGFDLSTDKSSPDSPVVAQSSTAAPTTAEPVTETTESVAPTSTTKSQNSAMAAAFAALASAVIAVAL